MPEEESGAPHGLIISFKFSNENWLSAAAEVDAYHV
jgi:hypothetical protein